MSSEIGLSQANLEVLKKIIYNQNNKQTQAQTKTPAADKFEKNTNSSAIELNTYQAPAKSNISFGSNSKYKIIAALSTTLALACAIGLIVNGRRVKDFDALQKTMQNTTNQLMDTTQRLQDTQAKIIEDQKAIQELEEGIENLKTRISDFAYDGKSFEALKNERIAHYEELIKNPKLDYDPLDPPADIELYQKYFVKKLPFVGFEESQGDMQTSNYAQSLLEKFRKTFNLELPLISNANTQEEIQKACIKNEDLQIFKIGEIQPAGMKLEYGTRTMWSDEKISRDILQNFFDANGHSLDGVGISIKKTGQNYKVKVSGNGLYGLDSLLELGSGSKIKESPYNAGGFGEGSRIFVANLLGRQKTSNVKFSCADWQIDFMPQKESIVRKLERLKKPINGNYIEFETSDKGLVESLIKSIDYFKHSKNTDFQNLSFDSKDFGFKILNPGQKGNLYLTQRFEYNKEGQWEGGVEGLNLIFKRKPDLEKYREITGNNFSTGRDRNFISNSDVYNLVKYFASDLSNEDLIKAISSTKAHWEKIQYDDNTAIKEFINALCDVAEKRHIGIDFKDIKLCKIDEYGCDETICQFVKSMGYKLITSKLKLDEVGMDTAKDVMKKSSVHKALNPDEYEIKKLKLLEEATDVIQKSIEATLPNKLKDLFRDCKDALRADIQADVFSFVEALDKEYKDSDFVKKYINFQEVALDEFNRDLKLFLEDEVSKLTNKDISKGRCLAKAILHVLKYGNNDELLKKYATQIQNLDIIAPKDVRKPRYIFDRFNEIANNTLGEAITDISNENFRLQYMGHWVDKTYFDKASFFNLLATWLHEISHKSGGDGSAEFTYKLTDLIEALTEASTNSYQTRIELAAIQEVFDNLKR